MDALNLNALTFQPSALMVFGIFLLCGVVGVIAGSRIKGMPTITSFMLLGLIIGPHGIGLITKPILSGSHLFIEVALGLILYKLGNTLHPKAIYKSKKLMLISLSETLCTFFATSGSVLLLGYSPALAALIGAIAISSSPAVLVHVAEELHAKGPVTEKAKSLVALNNLFSFLIFSIAMPFAMTSAQHSFKAVVIIPAYMFLGAAAVGIVVGWLAVKITKMLKHEDQHYRFALTIGAIMLTLSISSMIHVSAILSPLVLGMAVRWFETSKHNLSKIELGEGGDLFFIVLFVMAGAKIDPSGLLEAGFAVLLLVISRCFGKFMGTYITMPHMGFEQTQYLATSLLLTPMAGMAIGLVAATASLIPEMGVKIATIVFAMVAVFETIGPFAATRAFLMSKEATLDKADME